MNLLLNLNTATKILIKCGIMLLRLERETIDKEFSVIYELLDTENEGEICKYCGEWLNDENRTEHGTCTINTFPNEEVISTTNALFGDGNLIQINDGPWGIKKE